MKNYKTISWLCLALIVFFLMSSCCSVNSVVHVSDKCELGSSMGEASSFKILHLFGVGGPQATLKNACKNGNVETIYHVEETNTNYAFLFQKKTIRVYGDGPKFSDIVKATMLNTGSNEIDSISSLEALTVLENSKSVRNRIFYVSYDHYVVFKSQYNFTKKNPSAAALKDLQSTSNLINVCCSDKRMCDLVGKELEKAKSIDGKIEILIECAKQIDNDCKQLYNQ